MNYSQSLTYLNSFYDLEKTMTLPAGRRWKLERMRQLLKRFGNPEKSFLPVVIVGTKGKGSTGFFLQSIFRAAQISAGFYSSPHLTFPRERIRIGGHWISRKRWAALLTVIRAELERGAVPSEFGSVTYFEVMTLMAALAFKEAGVRAGIFEAGMGGRLDAVNALGAPIVIVTPVHLDHQEFLGETIAEIAQEKAAVIRSGADVIMAPQTAAARRVICKKVQEQHARLWRVEHKTRYALGLSGEHQAWNASAAVLAAEVVLNELNVRRVERFQKEGGQLPRELKVSKQRLQAGLAAKDWPGRFEIISKNPTVILDGAHNPAAVDVLVRTLKPIRCQGPKILIFGVTRDKDSQTMLKTLAAIFDKVIFVPLATKRGKSTAELRGEASSLYKVTIAAENPQEALHFGREMTGTGGMLVVTGSFYLIGALGTLRNSK